MTNQMGNPTLFNETPEELAEIEQERIARRNTRRAENAQLGWWWVTSWNWQEDAREEDWGIDRCVGQSPAQEYECECYPTCQEEYHRPWGYRSCDNPQGFVEAGPFPTQRQAADWARRTLN